MALCVPQPTFANLDPQKKRNSSIGSLGQKM